MIHPTPGYTNPYLQRHVHTLYSDYWMPVILNKTAACGCKLPGEARLSKTRKECTQKGFNKWECLEIVMSEAAETAGMPDLK